MPFDINFNEMSGQNGEKCPQNKIMDVITIDDDDEDEDNISVTNADETDDIEILEIIPKSETIIALNSSQLLDTNVINNGFIGEQTIDENESKPLNDSCNSCLQSISSLKDNLIVSKTDTKPETAVDSSDSQQNIMKSPKRIKPITLESVASTSKADIQNSDPLTDPTPNKVRRTSSPDISSGLDQILTTDDNKEVENPKPSTSTSRPKIDFEILYQNYLKSFKEHMIGLKVKETETEDAVKKLETIYFKVKTNYSKFLGSPQFAKLMEVFTKDILQKTSESEILRYHNDLILELNRFAQKPDKNTTPNSPRNRSTKVKALTDTIKKLQSRIYAAENEELDLNDLEKASSYTDLPKLYRKVQEVWTKREELMKRSTNTGRMMFKKYKCDSTPYPEINKCVENMFNKYLKKIKNKTTKGYVDESFTFIDVRKAILDVIKDKEIVVTSNCEHMIENLYKELLHEKRIRRQKDSEETFVTLESLDDLKPESFVADDPLIELELAKNKISFEKKMDEIYEKYAKEDKKKNGESVLKDGLSEWESDLPNNSEEFESLDVKDGELDDEDNEDIEEDSEEEIEFKATPIPDFSTKTENKEPLPTEPEVTTNGSVNSLEDEDVIILS